MKLNFFFFYPSTTSKVQKELSHENLLNQIYLENQIHVTSAITQTIEGTAVNLYCTFPPKARLHQ